MKNNKVMPWESEYSIWKTKGEFFQWLRGQLRAAVWNHYPIKTNFKNAHANIAPPADYQGRSRVGGYCALTGEWRPKNKSKTDKNYLQVDHIIGDAPLKEWSDIPSYIDHLLLCDGSLQLVSVESHKIKSYAERMGISYEEAEVEKKYIIPFKNLKAPKQKEIILKYKDDFAGDFEKILKEGLTTEKKRINIYRQLIKEKK